MLRLQREFLLKSIFSLNDSFPKNRTDKHYVPFKISTYPILETVQYQPSNSKTRIMGIKVSCANISL